MQISPKARLVSIIVAVVFMAGALIGSGTYLIINHINKANALLSETTYSLDNLVDTSDKSKLDTTTVTKILDILGDYNGSTIRTAADLKSLNANKPIVFQMGEINGNKIYWEAVYQTGAVLTIWMTNPYTAEWFNDEGYAMKNPDLAGYSTGIHDEVANYSQSGLRDVTKGIYTEQSQLFPAISSIVVSPSEALPDPNNEADKGIDWQKDCTSTAGVGQPDTGYAHHNGLQSANGTGSYTTWTWDSTAYNDKFWIPSYYEVFGKNTGKNNWTFDGGLWALTADDIKFSQTSNGLNGVSGVGSYCGLRSGYSRNSDRAVRVYSSGSAYHGYVGGSCGVRPAAHLSLSALEAAIPSYTISVTSNNQTYGTVSTSGGTYIEGSTLSVTATPNPNYQFVCWQRNGVQVSTSPTYEITVSGNDTYTAVFEPVEYTITIQANDENYGRVLVNNTLQTSIQITQDYGTQISNLYAISSAGYAFLYWLDSATGQRYTANPLTYTVSADSTLTAIFGSSVAGGVAVVAENGGEVRMSGYDENNATTMHVSAVAYKGYKFLGWYIMGEETPINTELSTDLALSQVQNKIIIARFIPIENQNDMNDETDNGQIDDFV